MTRLLRSWISPAGKGLNGFFFEIEPGVMIW